MVEGMHISGSIQFRFSFNWDLLYRNCSKPASKSTFTHEEELELKEFYERYKDDEGNKEVKGIILK